MYWGLSPALDLQAELERLKIDVVTTGEEDEVNFLVIGGFDCRHVLQTTAKRYTHRRRKINFFILEVAEELYARQLLLLSTAFATSNSLGSSEKTRFWMEIYGNTLIRPKTFEFFRNQAARLIKLVTDPDHRGLLPNVDLSQLQYKELDSLESVFEFYTMNRTYNPVLFWDKILRKSLGVRYDTRDGVFDWDYHMKLKDIEGCGIVHTQEYKYWRKTGIAFNWLETENSEPNLTLVSGLYKIGRDVHHCGFMGSTVNAPFVSFGLRCEDEAMMKKTRDRYLKRSSDLFERNLMRLFHEIEHGEPYIPPASPAGELNMGLVITELKNIDLEKIPTERDDIGLKKPPSVSDPFETIHIPDVKVHFLPCKTFRYLPEKFKNFFDLIWIGHNLLDHVNANLFEAATEHGCLLIETSKFLVHFSREDHDGFAGKVENCAKDNRFERVADEACSKNGVAGFKRKQD